MRKKNQRWDAANPETAGERLLAFGIDFREPYLRFEQLRCLLERGRHHFAGPAPFGPEINEERDSTVRQMTVEARRRKIDRHSGKERQMTFAALRAVPQPRRRNAIDCVIMRTYDLY